MTLKVQRSINTKYAPSHQVLTSITYKLFLPEVQCPSRKTRVNMASHIQYQVIVNVSVTKPAKTNAGLEARILQAKSRISTARSIEWRALYER
jgi:hypothetical protein